MNIPEEIRIVEIGPRDGFQSIKTWLPTEHKTAIVKMLLSAGVDSMEATSFISPKAIEQMKDASEVVESVKGHADMDRIYALVPNAKGAERAHEAGVGRIAVVISASEAHNLNNVRRTPEESLQELKIIRREFPSLKVKLSLGTAFGCPFQGEVADSKLIFLIDGVLDLGITDIALCDTVGVADPLQVIRRVGLLQRRYAAQDVDWGMHLHNTRGLAAANTFAALTLGINKFETAVGGLGGCPFAPGSSGNMATEDLLFMAARMGLASKADIGSVIRTAEYIRDVVGLPIDSKINTQTRDTVTAAQGRADQARRPSS
ncbi:MAG: hydroxymethylglutaryl-CoA lyase [Candidatus Adiutrix sp.]|jgi:hydroxymethylglutaryl-CoA lyase|nr:hydroxymethylglutaryl-CoA lyase [Candidatus Adiutrix sp.]